jgi:signal transduction histidine kinase
MPEFGKSFAGVYMGQIYTYSNAFIISTIISLTTIFRVLQIIRNNESMKQEVSTIHAGQNFSIIQGQLNERRRVGQELHDGIGIMMSAIKMKLSAIKPANKKEETILKSLIRDVDKTCSDIRSFSHELLPPTLQKFGLATALKDEVEKYKLATGQPANFNANITSDLNEVSAFITYDFIKSILTYFRKNKPDSLSISVYIIASIQRAQIRINYTGQNIDMQAEEMRSVQSVMDLLHGRKEQLLLNAWTFRLDIEYPVLLKQETTAG